MMEASASDIVYEKGEFAIAGTDRKVKLDDVVRRSFDFAAIPRDLDPALPERADWGPPGAATSPSGAHICEIEIDVETGKAALVRYAAVDDVGRMLNPLLCHGQIYGGIAQGVGQAPAASNAPSRRTTSRRRSPRSPSARRRSCARRSSWRRRR